MDTIDWAQRTAGDFIAGIDTRWMHSVAVAERARELAWLVEEHDREALVAAAYLHDIGYAPSIATTGFHPLDGAIYLRDQGHERVAGLVAHHSFARIEAELRGLAGDLDGFEDEATQTAKLLTYCDLTTGRRGEIVPLEKRISDISERHGGESTVTASLATLEEQARPLVASIERQIDAHPISR